MGTVEIVTIGDEILIGQTVDTNSAWLGENLNSIGLEIRQIRSIPDTREAIIQAMDSVFPSTKLVIVTGGLGPTKDDLTKYTLTDYFGGELEYHPEIFEHIIELFSRFGRKPNDLNKNQAWLPNNARILKNDRGTASGMMWKKDDRYYVSLPGVPYEMKHLMKEHILPWAKEELVDGHIHHHTILTQGVPESELATMLSDWEENLPSFIKLAYLPSPGMVKLRLTARGTDSEKMEKALEEEASKAESILGDVVYGEDDDRLEIIVGNLLSEQGSTLATAESCTGGQIATMITSVAGSSKYYLGSIVSYANLVKENPLGVTDEALRENGAVSEVVVRQMAEGIHNLTGADYCIATSGIAGPGGGSEEKPVGTVWIALRTPQETFAKRFQFGNKRDTNIRKTSLMALDMLRKSLRGQKVLA
ncbi:MAG: competence/damage-inducible protein A [Bacteroidota bacterium]|nr:competence/damage-inducible protein A [Bacteroidota bacterium]